MKKTIKKIQIPAGEKIGSDRKKNQRWSIAEILISASGGIMSVEEANSIARSWVETAIENKTLSTNLLTTLD